MKAIIKQVFDNEIKEWRIEVFCLDVSANFGFLWAAEVVNENTIMAGGEACLGYFYKCRKATKAQFEIAKKAFKKCYGEDLEIMQKLSDKTRKNIWR